MFTKLTMTYSNIGSNIISIQICDYRNNFSTNTKNKLVNILNIKIPAWYVPTNKFFLQHHWFYYTLYHGYVYLL